MPTQLRDARITQRSKVLSQHHGLVFRGTVTTYTDTTHFKISALPNYGDASDFPDNFFKDYYVYVVWDSAGTGLAPQGEKTPVTAYASSDGAFTHAAFTTPLAVGDEVLLIHPSAINASVIVALDEIEGTLFVSADDSLHAISTKIDEILDLTRTGSSILVSAAETSLFIDDAPSKIINGNILRIDLSNMAAGDTYDFKEYYRMESAGSYIEMADTITLSGAQSPPGFTIRLDQYRYGCKVTATKTAGTDRTFTIEAYREA
ncbi:MAG: hypothetical protein JRE23_08130 [Deltaproteobacteria bacterium]|nr:hypothetical protein [Deltaproteobacteria bacterium]